MAMLAAAGRRLLLWVAAGLLGCRGEIPASPPIPEAARPSVAPGSRPGRFSQPPLWSREPVPSPPASPDRLLDLGERLYGWNCLPCHGADGKGDGPVALRQGLHPRDFTRGLFKLKTSAPGEPPFDEDLYRTIAVGIPMGGMPRNRELDPPDRWALVAYVKSLSVAVLPDGTRRAHFSGTPSPGPAPSPPREAPDPSRGKDLFANRVGCAVCHGVGGKGDGSSAHGLRDAWDRPAPPPDLTRGALALKSGSEIDDVFRIVTLGMAGTPMPSFAGLPERDRWDLAAYVRSLFEPISEGEKIYLGAGCTACHTIGRGKLVGPDLAGVRGRRDRAWLRAWLADPPALMARDSATRKSFQEYQVQMPKLELTTEEIDALIDYLDILPPSPADR